MTMIKIYHYKHTEKQRTALELMRDDAVYTLLFGGARSGKSRYAETLVTAIPPPWIYVATAQAGDEEMRLRIAEHQAARGQGWSTVEAPLDLPRALLSAPGGTPILVDCITLWLSNLMLGGRDVDASVVALELALKRREASTIVVSNEVGLGIVPDTPLGRDFRDKAGVLNQRLGSLADRVIFMVAGQPMTVKGSP